MDIGKIANEICGFKLPDEFIARYEHCGSDEESSHASDVIGTYAYPRALHPEEVIPMAKFFNAERSSPETFHVFSGNLRLVCDFCYNQLFSDDPEQRRQTRFTLAHKQEFREDCERFLTKQLANSFGKISAEVQNPEELQIMVRAALYFCAENDARRERCQPQMAVDEFLDTVEDK